MPTTLKLINNYFTRFDTCAWKGPANQEVIKWKWPGRNEYVSHYSPLEYNYLNLLSTNPIDNPVTAKRKLERLQFSTSSSFVKI